MKQNKQKLPLRMRISELINLSNDCIYTTARNEHFLKVPLGKMNNERLVPLCTEAVGLIQKLKSSQSLLPKPHDKNRLIRIKGSIPHVYSHLATQFEKFTTHLSDQNKPITFHRLRHTYATSLLSGGVSIVSIMKLLGHRRIEMSLRYAQITPTHLRNEYFKAITALEQKFMPPDLQIIKNHISHLAPQDLILQLATFIKKEPNIKSSIQKNLARRLARLAKLFQQLPLQTKFPILPASTP